LRQGRGCARAGGQCGAQAVSTEADLLEEEPEGLLHLLGTLVFAGSIVRTVQAPVPRSLLLYEQQPPPPR
jgi:hypothetical protein